MSAIYTYECSNCKHAFEKLLQISDFETTQIMECPICHYPAKRIINNKGGLRNKPTWLPSACEVAVPDGERSPETRSEWNTFKKKEGFEEKESYGPVLVAI